MSATTLAQSPLQQQGNGSFRGLSDAERQLIQRLVSHTVREAGVVESSESEAIRCLAVGESVVLSVVPEGTRVKKGDLLVELDDSVLKQKLLEQQLEVAQSEVAVKAAQTKVAQVTERANGLLPFAKLQLEVAEKARDRYLSEDGAYQLELTKADRQISTAKHRLQALESMRQRRTNRDELTWEIEDAKSAVQQAEAAKKLLTMHVREHQELVLNLDIRKAQAELLQIQLEFDSTLQAAMADLKTKQRAHDLERERLSDLEQQVQHCRILAAQDGVVVYMQNPGRRSQTLEPGAVVRERQTLMQLPDLEKLHVDVSVHESQIERIQVGQAVTLQFDALPGVDVPGKVAVIDRVPKPTTWLAQDVVQYNVRVSMDDPPGNLKLGMSALAEIQVVPHSPN
ncbi:HlyD family secretion protein [Roseimaritima ulvae]|nr:efflux RND transporter periplasmic adaptor subunit [Roseimaritima ulvae]